MDISNLWTAWPVAGPWHLSPLPGGANNHSWRADAADGQSYVLRLSPDPSRIPHVYYEAELLQALSAQNLPFRLPVPLRASNGDLIVLSEQNFATLYPLLPGSLQDLPPQRNDLLIASHAGSTLALLDAALATIPEIRLPAGFTPPPTFGELALWHPTVSDPLVAIEQLPIDREQVRQMRTLLSGVIEDAPRLYTQLPQQLLHRDYDPANILIDHQQVTAVLDFEFAGKDIRVLDLCIALSWWPSDLFGTGKEWDLIDAFGAAYTHQFPLNEEVILAIPSVFRLRDATSFVHRMGRYLVGIETETRMQQRVKHSLWREEWLSAQQKTLLEHALTWK
ncbi:MAG TPA: phosphotransferase [Ktedonobacteraceae bacterium]|nr:phosphotransferase [Ktedonobacteraceae bacterium]